MFMLLQKITSRQRSRLMSYRADKLKKSQKPVL